MVRLIALLSALVLLLAAPAMADTKGLTDPVGDAVSGPEGPGLDIVGATFDNRARRVVVTVRFQALERDALIVSVERRDAEGVRMISKFRPGHRARSYVIPGAFTPMRTGRNGCRRYEVTWDRAQATATLSLPARCLNGGQYDELRFGVLTESDGGDTDYAPEDLSTAWIGRG